MGIKEFLIIGTIGMFFIGYYKKQCNKLSTPILAIFTLLLSLSGVLGTKVLYFIENGTFNGLSYYGAVFFIPVFMSIFALVFKQNVSRVLDFSAYAQCFMLGVMKIDCATSGCCKGIVLKHFSSVGNEVLFPSQILESINAFVIIFILFKILDKIKLDGYIYPIYFIIYGITRFIFNCFRGEISPFVWIIPAGHLWSLIGILVGLIWLIIFKNLPKQKELRAKRDELKLKQEEKEKFEKIVAAKKKRAAQKK